MLSYYTKVKRRQDHLSGLLSWVKKNFYSQTKERREVAVIEKGLITEFYMQYRANLNRAREIESGLVKASDRSIWVEKLAEKSDFLRSTYAYNEKKLGDLIYPFLRGELQLDVEIADEFFENIKAMTSDVENDSLLTTEVLIRLSDFYKKEGLVEKWILSMYMLGISYNDKSNDISIEKARDCFEQVAGMSDKYCEFTEWETRRRIIMSNNYSIEDKELRNNEERLLRIVQYENFKKFLAREDVRALDGDKIDLDEFLQVTKEVLMWALIRSDSAPNRAVLEYMTRELLPDGINRENLNEQTAVNATAYVWCNLYAHNFPADTAVIMLFRYYKANNKEIDYKEVLNTHVSNDAYQKKITCLQECFRILALPDITLDNRESLFYDMAEAFRQIYTSVPHLSSNGFVNDDLCRTVRLMLRTAYDEEESLEYIQEVILNRNSMTLIHSMMVGKIAIIIMNALIDKNPEMFLDVLGTRDVHLVKSRRQYLLNYIDRCAHLHDIGKAYISDVINQQMRKLTDEERALIKQHPTFGSELLAGTKIAEKYNSVVEGHHKSFDGRGGYPDDFDNVHDKMKIFIDIITIADCIDAATDTLGRNYTKSKMWLPALADELESDEQMRYNQEIVNIIKNDDETCKSISYITDAGRTDIYYDIYRRYISDKEENPEILIEQVLIK